MYVAYKKLLFGHPRKPAERNQSVLKHEFRKSLKKPLQIIKSEFQQAARVGKVKPKGNSPGL